MSHMIGGRLHLAQRALDACGVCSVAAQGAMREASHLVKSISDEIREVREEWRKQKISALQAVKTDQEIVREKGNAVQSGRRKDVQRGSVSEHSRTQQEPLKLRRGNGKKGDPMGNRDLEKAQRMARSIVEKYTDALMSLQNAGIHQRFPDDYSQVQAQIEQLGSQVKEMHDAKGYDFFSLKALQVDENLQEFIAMAEKRSDFDAIVEKTIESLASMGFCITEAKEQDGAVVILGRSGNREARLVVDKEKGLQADFSRGYESVQGDQCVHDAHHFISGLQENGLELEDKQEIPIVQKSGWYHGKRRREKCARQSIKRNSGK